jgi:hypothetical protein
MRQLHSEVEIDATPERVWSILMDFPAFPEWNPFIRVIEGDPTAGAKLKVAMQPPGGRGMTFKPTVLEATPQRELRWLGHLLVPGIFDGEHRLRVEPLDDARVRFVQSEKFTGVLVGPFGKMQRTQRGFEAMNEALKRRAEA